MKRLLLKLIPKFAGFLVFFALWHAIFLIGIVDSFLFPSPVSILLTFGDFGFWQQILPELSSSLFKLFFAILIGSFFGVFLGIILSKWNTVHDMAFPVADFFRSIPATALFPLFMLFFGIGELTIIALSAWVCTLYLSLHVSKGLKNTRQSSIAIAKVFKKSDFEILLHVKLREALPIIFVGFRTITSLTLVLVIVTEMFVGTNHGLGKAIIDSAYTYSIPKLYAIIFMIGIIGYLMNLLISIAEKKIVHWHEK